MWSNPRELQRLLTTISHLETGTLKYLIYHGDRRKDSAHLGTYDLVLTTYGTLSAELKRGGRKSTGNTGVLQSVEWFRVVLDEGESEQWTRSKDILIKSW